MMPVVTRPSQTRLAADGGNSNPADQGEMATELGSFPNSATV